MLYSRTMESPIARTTGPTSNPTSPQLAIPPMTPNIINMKGTQVALLMRRQPRDGPLALDFRHSLVPQRNAPAGCYGARLGAENLVWKAHHP